MVALVPNHPPHLQNNETPIRFQAADRSPFLDGMRGPVDGACCVERRSTRCCRCQRRRFTGRLRFQRNCRSGHPHRRRLIRPGDRIQYRAQCHTDCGWRRIHLHLKHQCRSTCKLRCWRRCSLGQRSAPRFDHVPVQRDRHRKGCLHREPDRGSDRGLLPCRRRQRGLVHRPDDRLRGGHRGGPSRSAEPLDSGRWLRPCDRELQQVICSYVLTGGRPIRAAALNPSFRPCSRVQSRNNGKGTMA